MMTLALGPSWLDPNHLLNQFGIYGLLIVVFAESGLLIGFFLPGDSLLFTTGLLVTTDQLDMPLWAVCALVCVAAVLGDQAGYLFGKKVGPSLFKRPDSRLFKQEYVEKAEYYFQKFGPAKAVVLARFIPIVRTFLNPVAGVLGMPARQFFLWNVVGAVLWVDGILLIGYLLADQIYRAIGDKIDRYILPVVALIIVISVLPIFFEFLRDRRARKRGEAAAVVAASSAAGAANALRDAVKDDERRRHGPQGR